ncbi:MAG TPA: glycosyltransferase family 4 protein [Thermoplasmata archaeon]|nr:glycosyltransferase family 4 protein [Thermoplasmata archaeon]
MRIVEATHRYPPALGGVEIQVESIASGLRARGHDVAVVTTDLDRDRPLTRLSLKGREEPGVRRHRAISLFPAPHGLGIVAPGVALDLLHARAQVVHAHAFGMHPTRSAAMVRRLRGVPLVVETHMDAGRATDGWWTYARAMRALTLDPADRVVGHTATELALLRSLGVHVDRLAQIPNGIDPSEFSGGQATKPPLGSPTVLFVGRLDPDRKGLRTLIESLGAAPAGFRLRLVGQDWNGGRALVTTLARRFGVASSVELVGPVDRAALLGEYARADLFVLPSRYECTPIVLMEAMAAGLPIIATRVGSVAEVVSEGRNALLVPADDPRELRTAIDRLLGDPDLRARFAASGRDEVRRFSWERVLPRWEELFGQVVG